MRQISVCKNCSQSISTPQNPELVSGADARVKQNILNSKTNGKNSARMLARGWVRKNKHRGIYYAAVFVFSNVMAPIRLKKQTLRRNIFRGVCFFAPIRALASARYFFRLSSSSIYFVLLARPRLILIRD